MLMKCLSKARAHMAPIARTGDSTRNGLRGRHTATPQARDHARGTDAIHRFSRGFTLVEAAVAATVFGVTVAVGIPALSSTVEHWQVRSATHRITTSLATARLHAATRNHVVTVCPSIGDGRCLPDGTWHQGWMIYADRTREDHPLSPDDILEIQQGLHRRHVLRTSAARPRIRFQGSGSSGGSTATFSLCDVETERLVARIILNNAGRSRTEHEHPADARCPR